MRIPKAGFVCGNVFCFWILAFYISILASPEGTLLNTNLGGRCSDSATQSSEDTQSAYLKSIYLNGTQTFIQNLFLLRTTNRPKMLIVGSSNAETAFDPNDLGRLFPEFEVHNISVRESNITQIIETIQVAAAVIPKEVLRNSVFVVGYNYVNFFENKLYAIKGNRLPNLETHLKTYFTPFLQVGDHSVSPRLPISFLLLYQKATRPFYYFQYLARVFPIAIQRWFQEKSEKNQGLNTNYLYPAVFEEVEVRCNNWVGGADGVLKDEQFEEIGRLKKLIQEMQSKLVLVELPAHPIHSRIGARLQYLRLKSDKYSGLFSNDSWTYTGSLEGEIPSYAFRDTFHSLPGATYLWDEALAQILKQILKYQ